MKILVLSDSHGQMRLMEQAVRTEQPDEIFHLGDHIRDAEQLERTFPTHGHRYHVKFGYQRLEYAAREVGAQVVLFGHTHVPYCEQYDGLWLLNPGACGGQNGSYGLVIIEDKNITCKLCKGETMQ